MTDQQEQTIRKIKAKGFSAEQSEAITDTVRMGITGGVAANADLMRLETKLLWVLFGLFVTAMAGVVGFFAANIMPWMLRIESLINTDG